MPEAITDTPRDTITRLLQSEDTENNNLLAILGSIRPTRSQKASGTSSLTSLVRGLCTKNTKLTQNLTKALSDMTSNGEMEVFKTTVNEFIIWLDQGGLTLFQRYCVFLAGMGTHNTEVDMDLEQLSKPLMNCKNYVMFIDSASAFLRNPFVLDKLHNFRASLAQVIADCETLAKLTYLNNIEFGNITLYFSGLELVSSYFSVKQITKRTGDSTVFLSIDSQRSRTQVELLLLDLRSTYHKDDLGRANALAIVDIANNATRSLRYPPFRVNELSMSLDDAGLVLLPIAFCDKTLLRRLVISSPSPDLLTDWHQSMLHIFPPSKHPHLVEQKQTAVLNGLGINIVSERKFEPEQSPEQSTNNQPKTQPNSQSNNLEVPPDSFKELIATPSLSSDSPLSQLQSHFDRQRTEQDSARKGNGQNESQNTQGNQSQSGKSHGQSQNVPNQNGSFSMAQPPSISSSRSMGIIQKTLTNGSIKLIGAPVDIYDPESSDRGSVPSPAHASVPSSALPSLPASTPSREYLSPTNRASRAHSEQGQISYATPLDVGVAHDLDEIECDLNVNENLDNLNDLHLNVNLNEYDVEDLAEEVFERSLGQASKLAPDLSLVEDTRKPKSIYQLSTGSAVDLNNFGKNYNPSFSIHKNMSDLVVAPKKQKPKGRSRSRSFFSFFKKNASKALLHSPCLPQSPDSSIERLYNSDEDNEGERKADDFKADDKNGDDSKANFKDSNSKAGGIGSDVSRDSRSTTRNATPISNGSSQRDEIDSATISQKSPGPFALPSSTSSFFKPYVDKGREADLVIPQELKDVINDDSSIDFFLSDLTPKTLIVSQWKTKRGTWEMLTAEERVFVKIVINYTVNKAWLLVFKEEYDATYGEEIDKPVAILDVNPSSTQVRHSSAIDIQCKAVNSITGNTQLILVRGRTPAIAKEVLSAMNNALGVLAHKRAMGPGSVSNNTISLLLMDMRRNTSTTTSLTSVAEAKPKEEFQSEREGNFSDDVNEKNFNGDRRVGASLTTDGKTGSNYSLNSYDEYNMQLIQNPANRSVLVLDSFPVRVQRKIPGCTPNLNELSSWNIIAMYELQVYVLTEAATQKNYYHLVLISGNDAEEFNWLINEDDRDDRVTTIGKAALILMVDEVNHYMVECRGRQELRYLHSVLMSSS